VEQPAVLSLPSTLTLSPASVIFWHLDLTGGPLTSSSTSPFPTAPAMPRLSPILLLLVGYIRCVAAALMGISITTEPFVKLGSPIEFSWSVSPTRTVASPLTRAIAWI
jgi:hypothetical protein